MGSKMLIDASHQEETRVVVLKGNRIEEFDFESAARRQLKGNIYLAKVTRVEPSLQAAFIEYGGNRHGFLAFAEIHPDYYQIPLADRMALLADEEEEHARERERDEEEHGNGHGNRQSSSRGGRRRGGEERSGSEAEARSNDQSSDDHSSDDHQDENGNRDHDNDHDVDHDHGSEHGVSNAEYHVEEDGEEVSEDHSEENGEDDAAGNDASDHDDDDDDNGGENGGGSTRAQAMATTHDDPSISESVEDDAGHRDDEKGSAEHHDEDDHEDDNPALVESSAPVPTMDRGMPGELGNGVEELSEDPEAQKVESIGAEDALEEVPQRRRKTPRRQYKIQEVIKRRQVILVQVVKEERGNKGAALTTYLSLAGRYCVLMPNTARGGGISRKITDSGDRRRLKEVAREIEVPQGMGLIVRTAGAQRTKTEIKRDYDYLLRLWESVRDLTLKSQAPALVYEEGSLVKRAIRDLYTKDVDEVVVEGDAAYREAKDFMKMLMPSHAKNVKPYKDTRPLFSRYQAESQLDGLYSPTVTLPSGGYMVINQTEALVAVDINSGKSTREHNIEDTALRTNLEAADEIARQLRLRDLAGLVVIDFIDMEEKRNNRNVERRLKDALKNDRARIQVGHISHFGLLEMSRQRLRPGLLEGSSRTCPHCEGRGIVRSISSCGLSVLRAIEEHLIARKPENLTVKCTREIAFYILNEKRDNLLTIETSYGISVFITPSDELKGSQAVIERAPDRNIPLRKVLIAPVRIDSAFEDEDEEQEDEVPEAEAAGAAEQDSDSDDDDGDEGSEAQSEGLAERQGQNGDRPDGGKKRRRRRGRRGGRGREDQQAGGAEGEIPGLGDQPSAETGYASGGEEAFNDVPEGVSEAPEASGAAEGSETAEGETRDRGRGGKPRRDRWGRNRDRNRGGEPRERPDRPVAEASETAPAEDFAPEPAPAPKPTPAPKPASAPAPTVAEAPAEPVRKWQPPAPTVAAEVVERKSGWWSKK